MRMGKSISGNYNFPVFNNPNGSYWETPYGVGQVDGRGVSDGLNHTYKDVRDKLGAVVFQRYSFVHKARYMVFEMDQVKKSGKFSVHIIKGDSDNKNDREYFEILEKTSSTKTHIFIVDLGAPSFKEKDFTVKIGWGNYWIKRDEKVIFRMIKTYKNSKDGKVKVFFVVDDDNSIESVKVGNRVVPVESGYQYYVDKEVAEQIDKVTLDFSEHKPKLTLKEGEELEVIEKTEKEK